MRIVLLISIHEVSVKLCIHMIQITGKVILSLNNKQLLASGGGGLRGAGKRIGRSRQVCDRMETEYMSLGFLDI